MDIRSCKIIKTIAEEKNLTKASNKLFISQSTLTYTLKAIEEEVGASLFFRTPKGMKLTLAGETLLNFANKYMLSYNETLYKIKQITDNDCNELRIGVFSMYAHDEFQDILNKFIHQHPNISIRLRTGINDYIIQLLLNQEVDLAIIVDYDPTNLEGYELTQGIAYAVYDKEISLEDLENIPRVLYMPKSTNIQNRLDNCWNRNFSTPYSTYIGVDDFQLLYTMVRNGHGWASVCNVNKKYLPSDLFFLNLVYNNQKLTYPIYVIINDDSFNLEHANLFKDFILKFYSH